MAASGVVKGVISITDNLSATLRAIKKEQSAFRKDVEKTRKELEKTWDKKRTARLDATAASKAAKNLKQKLDPLRKKVVTAMAVKDSVTAKVKSTTNKVKALGKMVAAPIVKIKDLASAGISKIGGALKNLASKTVVPLAVASTAAAGAVLGGSITQGAALEQSIGGVETLFKGDASVVKANADKAFQTAGLSANEYMQQVTSFSASLISSLGGDTAKAASVADMAMQDMADNANKFGTDAESIQNAYQGFAKQNYDMLDNLKLGYGGTKEEMQRLLSDAQKFTGVQYDISSLSDVYSAIHAIQENLGVTGTTAKEASRTFSGSFSAMKAAAQNVLGNMAIGGDVTGSMQELMQTASTFLLDNAVPMFGRIISSFPSAVKAAAPQIKAAGKELLGNLRSGIVSILPTSMGNVVNQLFDGFESAQPALSSFASSVTGTFSQVSTSVMPAIGSILDTVSTTLPAILPVIQTVVGTIGSVISAAAPVIAGLVQGIGTVVSELAPVFSTVFSGIGEKVGSVLSFVGEQMGWIQEVISTAMPVVSSIITGAWSVISPVLDIAISVFKLLFNVTKTVFTGIVNVVSAVWDKISPIVEGISSGLSWVADKLGGLFGGGGDSSGGDVGSNAQGTNNWRGGPTWVGENGPELIELPRGTRILPHKESVATASNILRMQRAVSGTSSVPASTPPASPRGAAPVGGARIINITIAKLADTIIVREEADINRIAKAVANEVVLAAKNAVPA